MKTFAQLKEELAKESNTIVVDGVTRSRLNSNGKPIYPTEEGIINFWKWFGDSQVVDKNGSPLVMFHGTNTWERKDGRQLGDIHSFNRNASVDIVRRPPSGDTVGSWFSNKVQGGADQYGGTFYPVYLKVLDAKRTTFNKMKAQAYELDKGFPPADIHTNYSPETMEPYRKWLKSEGYDGLQMIHDDSNKNSTEFLNQIVYVVLEPTQIKSAIGNKGSFDGSSDKIVEAELFHKTLKESNDIDWIAGIPVMADSQYDMISKTFPKVRFIALTESGLHEHYKYPAWDTVWEMDKSAPLNESYYDIINESVDAETISELFDPVESSYGNNSPVFDNKQMGGKYVGDKFALATFTKFNDIIIGITFRQTNKDGDEWSVDFRVVTDPSTAPSFDRQSTMINSIKMMSRLYSSLAFIIKDVAADHKEFRVISFSPAPVTSQEDKLTSLYNKFQGSSSFQKMITNIGWKHIKDNRYIRAADKIVEGVNQTQSPEFKKWFGDSKVVDKNGNPLVVYHGTAADVSAFDSGVSGKNYGDNAGFFFTSKSKNADVYSGKKEGSNTIPVYIYSQNPKVYTTKEDAAQHWYARLSLTEPDKVKANVHDGIIVKGRGGEIMVIVFNPNQIKSAIGNNGKFSDSPNITEAESTYNVPYDWNEPTSNPFARGWTNGDIIIDWIKRHKIPTENGKLVFYHATPKKGGATGYLRKGSLLETDPESAAHYASRDRGISAKKDVIVYKLLLTQYDIEVGSSWASLRNDYKLSESINEEVKLKPLYVHRPLLNPQPLILWAKEQGFTKTLTPDDFHVTIVYSKKPLDWNKFTPDTTKFKNDNDDRAMDKFGDAVVLKFSSPTLNRRHEQFKNGGASWDYPDYQPHVTITYDGGDVNHTKIIPYDGILAFGPEEFEDLDEDWSESIDETLVESVEEDFVSAYGEDVASDVFYHAKQTVMNMISNRKRSFMSAIEQDELLQKNGVGDYTMEYFVPILKQHGFPKHASKEWGLAEQDFEDKYLSK